MRSIRCGALSALLIAAAAAVPAAAQAQDVHGWTLCTPSSFHSCHSVSIGTTPIFTGSVRTGTGITISLTNLQGSGFAADNTSLSGLFRVFFSGRNFPLPMIFGFAPFNATMTGGGSGGANWYMETGVQPGTSNTVHYVDGQPNGNGTIGGCASGALLFGYVTSANTCGAGAMAVFNFSTGSIFDAAQMETVYIQAFGNSQFDFCFSNPGAAPDPGFPQCDVHNEFLQVGVVPEPITVALLGTGLLGIGGARLKRRRKPEAEA